MSARLDFGAFDEIARARIDFDVFAFFDVERHVDFIASFERGGLGATRRSIAFDTRVGFRDFEHDERGQFDADGASTIEEHFDFDVVFEEGHGIFDVLGIDVDLFVVRLIHEHELVFLLIEVFHFAHFEVGLADRIARTEVVRQYVARDEAFVSRLYEGNAFTRLDVLAFDDDKRLAIDFDLEILSEFLC